jgi:hypothetical protein
MSEVPTGKVVKPHNWLEDERSEREEVVAAVEAHNPDKPIDPLPDRVDAIELRPDDLIAPQWSGFVTSRLPDLPPTTTARASRWRSRGVVAAPGAQPRRSRRIGRSGPQDADQKCPQRADHVVRKMEAVVSIPVPIGDCDEAL